MPKSTDIALLTTNVVTLLYAGEESVPLDDPAENCHEASKLNRPTLGRELFGRSLLERSPELQRSAARSSKSLEHLPGSHLPAPLPCTSGLDTLLRTRRSARDFVPQRIPLPAVSALLFAGYGVTTRVKGTEQRFRTVPSGGALYPLDIYCLLTAVDDVEDGLYHYDPLANRLSLLPVADARERVLATFVQPDQIANAGVLLLVAATFWRSRFKYGQRGYRFALFEAGHVAQNVMLAATAQGLGSCAIGGYYDVELDAVLGLDGVNESILYALAVGAVA